MQSTQHDKMFMVTRPDAAKPIATGNRLAVGAPALSATVSELLPGMALSPDSKVIMQKLTEQDQSHVLEMFKGRQSLRVYNERQSAAVDIYLISGARGL